MSPPTGPQSCLNCGHPAGEHTYDLDGRAGSGCWHAEEWDKDGWPASQMCDCTDYNDGDPRGTYGRYMPGIPARGRRPVIAQPHTGVNRGFRWQEVTATGPN